MLKYSVFLIDKCVPPHVSAPALIACQRIQPRPWHANSDAVHSGVLGRRLRRLPFPHVRHRTTLVSPPAPITPASAPRLLQSTDLTKVGVSAQHAACGS